MAWFRCMGGSANNTEPYICAEANLVVQNTQNTNNIPVQVYAQPGIEIIFVVMHRSNITETPTGCTLIYKTASASADGQCISFYKATFDSSGTISGKFKQSASNRMALTYVYFQQGTVFDHSGDYLAIYTTLAYTFNAPNKTPGARLLWAVSMNAMDTSGSVSQLTSPADLLEFSYPPGNGNAAPRLAVYYDDGTGTATGRTFYNNGSQYDTACIIDAIEIS